MRALPSNHDPREVWFSFKNRRDMARAQALLRGTPAIVKGQDGRCRPQVQVPGTESGKTRALLEKEGIHLAGGPYPVHDEADQSFSAAEARARFSEVLSAVAHKGERILITWHGKGVAAIVPIDDLKALQEMEDADDARAARRALREAVRKGTVSLEQVSRQFRSQP